MDNPKPYNLTYFITFIAVATFRDHKYVTSYIKPYKRGYIEDFITLNKNNYSMRYQQIYSK